MGPEERKMNTAKQKPMKKPAANRAAGNRKQETKQPTPKLAQKKQVVQQEKSLRKNVSQKIPNGKFIVSNDKYFYGTDGKSDKTRMGTVVDSNRKNEVAVVKYTNSTKHGTAFQNSKGFNGHGDKVYTLDNTGKPIKIDNKKFAAPGNNRDITPAQANEIKRRNIQESRYKAGNRSNLKKLKGRKKT